MLEFQESTLETPGFFSFKSEEHTVGAESTTDALDAAIDGIVEMESLVKKNFMMPQEKLK